MDSVRNIDQLRVNFLFLVWADERQLSFYVLIWSITNCNKQIVVNLHLYHKMYCPLNFSPFSFCSPSGHFFQFLKWSLPFEKDSKELLKTIPDFVTITMQVTSPWHERPVNPEWENDKLFQHLFSPWRKKIIPIRSPLWERWNQSSLQNSIVWYRKFHILKVTDSSDSEPWGCRPGCEAALCLPIHTVSSWWKSFPLKLATTFKMEFSSTYVSISTVPIRCHTHILALIIKVIKWISAFMILTEKWRIKTTAIGK